MTYRLTQKWKHTSYTWTAAKTGLHDLHDANMSPMYHSVLDTQNDQDPNLQNVICCLK